VLKSIAITAAVSVGVAAFLTNFNIVFWTSVVFATIIQVAAWNIFTYYNNAKLAVEARTIDDKLIEELGKQQTQLPCAYCDATNTVDIRLDQPVDFECTDCKKTSAVYIDIETAQKTEPINTQLQEILHGE